MKKASRVYLFLSIILSLLIMMDLSPAYGESDRVTYDFIVNVTGDGTDANDANLDDNLCANAVGDCTLRAALEQSKPLTNAGHTVNIYFDLTSPATIVLHNNLPTYTDANLINDDPLAHIRINGNSFGGLIIAGEQNTRIQGLIFEDFGSDGLLVYFNGTDTIANNVFVGNNSGILVSGLSAGQGTIHITGNYIGYDPYTESRDSNHIGIEVYDVAGSPGDNSLYIGGSTAEDGNVIAGNGDSGIYIDTEDPNTDIFILNNYIGMVDDTTAEYNYEHGIEVVNNLGILNIGGDYLTQGNLIAGNRRNGIYISKSTTTSILGNTFSANALGTEYIPNMDEDLVVYDSTYLRIGGDSPEFGNVIPQGLSVSKKAVNNQNLTIKHNFIGISRNGFLFPISPALDGIYVNNVTGFPEISYNTITGFQSGIVVGANSVVPMIKNKIFGNRELGIDLNDDGISLNDNLDVDTGPNGLQNFPIISNVALQDFGAIKIVDFDISLESAPNKQYYVEVYSSRFCSGSGYGEGEKVLTWSSKISTDDTGHSNVWHVSDLYPTNIIGPCLTATATEWDGVHYLGTSEFSLGVLAWQPNTLFLPLILK